MAVNREYALIKSVGGCSRNRIDRMHIAVVVFVDGEPHSTERPWYPCTSGSKEDLAENMRGVADNIVNMPVVEALDIKEGITW